MATRSKRHAVLLGVDGCGIETRHLLEVLEGLEGAVLGTVRDDGRGLRAPQGQTTFQLDRRRRIHIDPGDLVGGEVRREIPEHGTELLVRPLGAERAHLSKRARPSPAILAHRHHDFRGVTLRAEPGRLLPARPVGELRRRARGGQPGRDDHGCAAHLSAPSGIRTRTAYHRRLTRIPGCRRPRIRHARRARSWRRCSTARCRSSRRARGGPRPERAKITSWTTAGASGAGMRRDTQPRSSRGTLYCWITFHAAMPPPCDPDATSQWVSSVSAQLASASAAVCDDSGVVTKLARRLSSSRIRPSRPEAATSRRPPRSKMTGEELKAGPPARYVVRGFRVRGSSTTKWPSLVVT